jgi:hypothetical protein
MQQVCHWAVLKPRRLVPQLRVRLGSNPGSGCLQGVRPPCALGPPALTSPDAGSRHRVGRMAAALSPPTELADSAYCAQNCATGEEPNHNLTDCQPCGVGWVSTFVGFCHECEGATIPNDELSGCASCPPGSEPTSAHSGCEECQPGRYATFGTRCMPCRSGFHTPNFGTHSCQACHDGLEATSDQTECVCSAGYFNVSLYPGLKLPSSANPDGTVNPCLSCERDLPSSQASKVFCPGARHGRGRAMLWPRPA